MIVKLWLSYHICPMIYILYYYNLVCQRFWDKIKKKTNGGVSELLIFKLPSSFVQIESHQFFSRVENEENNLRTSPRIFYRFLPTQSPLRDTSFFFLDFVSRSLTYEVVIVIVCLYTHYFLSSSPGLRVLKKHTYMVSYISVWLWNSIKNI